MDRRETVHEEVERISQRIGEIDEYEKGEKKSGIKYLTDYLIAECRSENTEHVVLIMGEGCRKTKADM